MVLALRASFAIIVAVSRAPRDYPADASRRDAVEALTLTISPKKIGGTNYAIAGNRRYNSSKRAI